MPKPPCILQQELIEEARRHLIRLSELARREAAAIAANDTGLILAIDKEIEIALGEKERCLGALRQHQTEHGC